MDLMQTYLFSIFLVTVTIFIGYSSAQAPHIQCTTDGAFRCSTQSETPYCIDESFTCDGANDCQDGQDETDPRCLDDCSAASFRCISNIEAMTGPYCIHYSLVCDGTEQCLRGDDEDELACSTTCSSESFRCANGDCVPGHYRCDYVNDCDDSSDEDECAYPACAADEWRCDNHRCIPRNSKCNRNRDCSDGSDETLANCGDELPCPIGQAKCRTPDNTPRCMDYQLFCNQHNDCGDNYDEEECGVDECALASNQCQHQCINRPHTYECTCYTGYKLKDDKLTCEEINECEDFPRMCSQLCTNTIGSYTCSCHEGFTLGADGVCSSTAADDPFIIFGNRYYIRRVNLDGTNFRQVGMDNDFVHVLDYDFVAEKIYYADVRQKKIKKMDTDGSNVEELIWRDLDGVEGLAFDWITKKIYWTDGSHDSISVAKSDGTQVLVLLGNRAVEQTSTLKTTHPRAIVLNPSAGYLYWSDWTNVSPFIGRMGMDGSEPTLLVTDHVFWPNGLTIDTLGGRLYWADAYLDYIASSNLDGSNVQVILRDVPHPYALTMFQNQLFWSEWNILRLETALTMNGGNRSVMIETIHMPYDVHVYHSSLQPPLSNNPCANNNGGCDQLCLLAPNNGRTCKCVEHFILDASDGICKPECPPGGFRCTEQDDHKCLPQRNLCDGQNDCKGGEDERQNCTYGTSRYCPTSRFQCDDQRTCPYQVQVCDGRQNCPDSSDEDPTMCAARHCLFHQEFRCASGRCIPTSYLCDGDNDCGDMSDEEGCNTRPPTPAVGCTVHQFQCTNGRCIDSAWYCDIDNDCGDWSDEPREECARRNCPQGWTKCEHSYRCIPNTMLCDGKIDCRDYGSDERAELCPTCSPVGDFTCANGRCIPFRWRCDGDDDCQDGSDEEQNMCRATERPCSESEFECGNGRCVRKLYKCDGDDDCNDNTDEISCENHECTDGRFKCRDDHLCIPGSFQCDGDRDCVDATDEENCTPNCPDSLFVCDNNVCLNPYLLCDSDDDCGDGSDERVQHCANVTTCELPKRFECNDGSCIPGNKRCDGQQDCPDGSDENNHQMCDILAECNSNEFPCPTSKLCIPYSQLCNGVQDCGTADNGDEHGCHNISYATCAELGCSHNCVDLEHRLFCQCRTGYKTDSVGTGCEDIDECASLSLNNCQQLCTNQPGTYSCQCADGFQESRRGGGTLQCLPTQGDPPYYIMAEVSSISRYIPQSDVYTTIANGQGKVTNLDVDYEHGLVFWTDATKHGVNRASIGSIDGVSYVQNLTQTLRVEEPHGIAYDSYGDNIYFTDAAHGYIYVARSDGRYRRLIFSDVTQRPTDLVLSSRDGIMFWINSADRPTIDTATMSGLNRRTIVSTGLRKPGGLTLDLHMRNRLYWYDWSTQNIESVASDGSDRQIIKHLESLSPLSSSALSLEVYNSSVYYVRPSSDKINLIDKFGRGVPETVMSGGLNHPYGLKVVQKQRFLSGVEQPICGRCNRLCLMVPEGAQCACPNGDAFLDAEFTHCSGSEEPPLTPPDVCECRHGGVCQLSASGHLLCQCQGTGHHGTTCQIPDSPPPTPPNNSTTASPQTLPSTKDSGSDIVPVVIPILVLLILVLVAVGVVFYLYRKGVIGKGKRTARGTFVAKPEEGLQASGQSDAVSYNAAGGTLDTKFSNPVYDVIEKEKREADQADVGLSGITLEGNKPVESISSNNNTLNFHEKISGEV